MYSFFVNFMQIQGIFFFTKCWIQIDAFRIGYLHGIVDMSVTLLLHSKK